MTPYQYGANNPIKFIDINGGSIIVGQALENNIYSYKAFEKWQNSEDGQRFTKLDGKGGKYEHIPVVFDITYDPMNANGSTKAYAVNKKTGEKTALTQQETIDSYKNAGGQYAKADNQGGGTFGFSV